MDKELANIKEEARTIELKWREDKDVITSIRAKKTEIEKMKLEEEKAERAGDLQKVAEIRYGNLPQLTKDINEAEQKLAKIQQNNPLLKEEVGEEDIAQSSINGQAYQLIKCSATIAIN